VGRWVVLALRAVIVTGVAGSIFVQTVMMALLWADLEDSELAGVRLPIVVILVLGFLAVEVVLVCVWRLLTMVGRGTVFSSAAFRYVDIVMAAVGAASLLTFGLAATLAPGEAVAPGVVLLIGGAAVMIAGVALVVFVMRSLLAQAVARDAEAHSLRAELDEVI
jgi:hypothetical protein